MPTAPSCPARRALGVLGRMARGWTSFEVFRNPVSAAALRTCAAKHWDFESELRRPARARKRRRPAAVPVRLWVITPTLSRAMRVGFRLRPVPGWPTGFFD